MSEPTPRENWTLRAVLGSATMAFAMAMVVAVVVKGDPVSPLHKATLDWAWMMMFAVLGGFGLVALKDIVPWKKP